MKKKLIILLSIMFIIFIGVYSRSKPQRTKRFAKKFVKEHIREPYSAGFKNVIVKDRGDNRYDVIGILNSVDGFGQRVDSYFWVRVKYDPKNKNFSTLIYDI